MSQLDWTIKQFDLSQKTYKQYGSDINKFKSELMISKIKKEVKSIWKKKKQQNERGNVEKYLLSIMNPRTVFDNISECIMVEKSVLFKFIISIS